MLSMLYMAFGKNKEKNPERKTREERFRIVATRRVNDILHTMGLLRNCAEKANYNYTDEQIGKIFKAVEDEWKLVKLEFNKHKSKKKEFTL